MVRIGPRLWKTGLAIAIALSLAKAFGLLQLFSALAAAYGVAPTASRSFRTAARQIGINLLAGLVGGTAAVLFGNGPIVVALSVVAALVLCGWTGLREARDGVIGATIFTMAPHAGTVEGYITIRWLSVALGIVVGVAVNALIAPPDYRPKTVAALKRAGAALDSFLLHVVGRLSDPQGLAKAEILAAAAKVEAPIAESRRLLELATESEQKNTPGQHHSDLLARALKVLTSLLERMQVMHKAALTACQSPGYPQRLSEVQAAVRELVAMREAVYARLEGVTPPPNLLAELEAMEKRFLHPPVEPEGPHDVLPYFQRYRVRSSLAEMANRLARLHVAMDQVGPPMAAAGPGAEHGR